jgi:transposase
MPALDREQRRNPAGLSLRSARFLSSQWGPPQTPLCGHLYAARHLIENFFARLKQFRAIATRYDKTARNFLAAVYLAASVVWLN